ncbi:MAG TPA: sugar porter family MFS transporter [Cyclobacteriaceae bacterium]|nr:sugar porter family MFS transporter [Cyclobacteriaceae bacterium]
MNNRYLYWITFVSVSGGVIFGLNMAGISGAIPFLKEYYALDDLTLGLAVSSIIVGCLVGSLFAGTLADKYGRKSLMLITAILFIVSSLGCSLASSFWVFILSRIVAGIAVGGASVLSPTYISEIAPASKRGALVSCNQLAVVVGIVLAYFINFYLVEVENGWRLMMGAPLIFSVAFLILLNVSFPESPRWLLKVGQSEKALTILRKIEGDGFSVNAIDATYKNNEPDSKVHVSELFKGKVGYVILLGSLLAAFQQITGINAVINYAPAIFESAGVGTSAALLQSIIVGFVNLVFTVVAIRLVDIKGRKTLLMWGAAGMTLSLGYLSFAFTSGGIGVLISLLGYIAFFAASLAPVMWVVTTEMYPTRIRGLAMSFSTTISWICTLLVVQFFPWMLNNLGGMMSFGIFAALSAAALVFIIIYIPETKGKSLEQIERELKIGRLQGA